MTEQTFKPSLATPFATMLEVSTGNITRETAEWLQAECASDCPTLIVYDKIAYGFFIPITDALVDNEDGMQDKIPADLMAVLGYAIQHECRWVMFDRDAEGVDGLPHYDW